MQYIQIHTSVSERSIALETDGLAHPVSGSLTWRFAILSALSHSWTLHSCVAIQLRLELALYHLRIIVIFGLAPHGSERQRLHLIQNSLKFRKKCVAHEIFAGGVDLATSLEWKLAALFRV